VKTLLQIGTDVLLIITSTGHRLFSFINNDDLEPPKLGVFLNFFVILGCDTHFKSELHQNG